MKSDIVRASSCQRRRGQISLSIKKAETAQESLTSTQGINTVPKETTKGDGAQMCKCGEGKGRPRNTSSSIKSGVGIVESTKKTHKAFCLQFTWLESQVDVAHTQKDGERKKLSLLVHEFISLHLFFITKCHWGDKDAAKSHSCHSWRLFSSPTTER